MKRYGLMGLLALSLSVSGMAWAQSDTTRIVVSFPPGGPVDSVARLLADQLSKELGGSVIVENRAGANGAIGANAVARAEPDGRTLWLTSVGAVAINPALYENLNYDPVADFEPVSRVVDNVELLVVNADNPANTAPEFVAASRASNNPLAMASSGIGSIPHLAMEQFAMATDANLIHVPYKGAAPAITDLIGGQVDGFFGDVTGLYAHVQGGRLKPIGLASMSRNPALPDVPTLAEQGIEGVDSNNWYALFAPAGTPADTIDRLNQAVRAALANETVSQRLLSTGSEPSPSSPAELAELLASDTAKWTELIQARGIQAQ